MTTGTQIDRTGRLVGKASSVKDFGAVGDGVADDTTKIQAGIDYLYALGGGTLYFPSGIYNVTSLTRRSQVNWQGDGAQATIIRALPSTGLGMILTAPGPVLHAGICDLALYGGVSSPANAGQWALYSEAAASATAPFNGGEWYSDFTNVVAFYFDNGAWFKGGDAGFLLPHQFITFKNTSLYRFSNTGVGLKLTGQCGQFTDINGQYDGKVKGQGTNIFLGRNGAGTNAPYSVNFIGTTSQLAERAIDIDNSRSISITGGNFEELYRAVRASAASIQVNLRGSRFSNAGSDGAAGGYIFQLGASSYGDYSDCTVLGTFDKVISNVSSAGITMTGNSYPTATLADTATAGVSVQLNVNAGPPVSLDTQGFRDVTVNTSASVITVINSSLSPSEMLVVTALSGPLSFASGGNIQLPGSAAAFSLPQNSSGIFKRGDLAGLSAWSLISVEVPTPRVSPDNGDAPATLQAGVSVPTQVWNTPLSVARAVTLDTSSLAYNGAKFRITRTAAATGASALNVGTGPLKALAAGQWCDVEYNGAAWVLTAFGSL